MQKDKTLRLISYIAGGIGYMMLIVGIVYFLVVNAPIFDNIGVISSLFAIGLAIIPVCTLLFAKFGKNNKLTLIVSITLFLIALALFFYIVISGLIIDLFQPLALSTLSTILLAISCALLILSAVVLILTSKRAMSMAITISLAFIMIAGIVWANTQDFKPFGNIVTSHSFIFENGEGGYSTFRIPSLINAKYATDKDDALIAFAEGRKDSSKDLGDIDIVYKTSFDNGVTWSELRVLLTYGDEHGKYGNATAVYDGKNNILHLAYLGAKKDSNYDYKTYTSKYSLDLDGTLTQIGDTIDISLKSSGEDISTPDGVRSHTLMVGPGKSVIIEDGEYEGRIVVPASSGGYAYCVFSDDGGNTWQMSESAGNGNENEIVTLDNGTLVMVARAMNNCSAPHHEQYQLLSYSNNGGSTWHKKNVQTTLKTPICMSSIAYSNGVLYMSHPDSFTTRANLSLGISKDNGNSFTTHTIYSGASGYSCVLVTSQGKIFVLAEIGKVNYNEALVFAQLTF